MKPAVPQPMEGGPEPEPKPVATGPGRLRGLPGQYVAGAGDGDGGAGGDRGVGVDRGESGEGVGRKPEPDPKPVATVPGRLRGLPGQYVAGAGDGDVGAGGDRGAGVDRGESGARRDGDGGPWFDVQRRKKANFDGFYAHTTGHDDILQFVADVNKHSRQKRGGFAPGPSFVGPINGCPLCGSGLATCLGKSCLGKPNIGSSGSVTRREPVQAPLPPSTIPGLSFVSR